MTGRYAFSVIHGQLFMYFAIRAFEIVEKNNKRSIKTRVAGLMRLRS